MKLYQIFLLQNVIANTYLVLLILTTVAVLQIVHE